MLVMFLKLSRLNAVKILSLLTLPALCSCRCPNGNVIYDAPAEQVSAFFSKKEYYVYAYSISGTIDTVKLTPEYTADVRDQDCRTDVDRLSLYINLFRDSTFLNITSTNIEGINIQGTSYDSFPELPSFHLNRDNTANAIQLFKRVNGVMKPIKAHANSSDSTSVKPASVRKILSPVLLGKEYAYMYVLEDTAKGHIPFKISAVADVGITEVQYLNDSDGKIHTISLVSYK